MQQATIYAIHGTRRGPGDLLPGQLRLRQSVGAGGANGRPDVAAIQASLNGIPEPLAGPAVPLATDGLVGPKTLAAIRGFQAGWLDVRDGRIDPDGPTLACLNAAAGAPSSRAPGDLPERATGPAAQAWGALGSAVVAATGFAAIRAAPAAPGAPRRDPLILDIIRAMVRLDDLRDNVLFGVEMAMKAAVRMAERAFDYANLLVTPSRGLPGWNSRVAPNRLAFLLLAKHFHLSEAEPNRALAAATRVLEVARRIHLRTISRRGAFGVLFDQSDRYISNFRLRPGDIGAAYNVGLGGADRPTPLRHNGDRSDRIYLTPLWDLGDSTWKQCALIHELTHFVGGISPGIDDHAYAYQAHYAGLVPSVRLRNTDCYVLYLAERYHGTVSAANARSIEARTMGNFPFVEAGGEVILPDPPDGKDDFAFPCSFPRKR
jgi:hypothetical protein